MVLPKAIIYVKESQNGKMKVMTVECFVELNNRGNYEHDRNYTWQKHIFVIGSTYKMYEYVQMKHIFVNNRRDCKSAVINIEVSKILFTQLTFLSAPRKTFLAQLYDTMKVPVIVWTL